MTDVDWKRAAEIFADTLDRPPGERAAFVAAQCTGAPELKAVVERLLSADAAADEGFLESSVDPELIAEASQATTPSDRRLGPWRLVREIGRGGMGQVFRAERADGQFEQQVALKLLKRGMDSDAILARFLRERQILAGLDHPNIARLLDGGIADDGRPYFVLELVDGMPITEYADEQRLDVGARVTLFRQVCRAVAYAHRNLIVHRDLKPSNILVTRDGRPKLLDFGIAKLLAPEGASPADTPTLTMGDARLMTPAYAAPEQIRGAQVTTSTDVYGLGAVLYELLSGKPPFPAGRDRLDLPLDAEPALLSFAPHPPAKPEDLAAARSTDRSRLRRRLAGDLETIAAVSLRADPERRYASVEGLEDDLRRHQEGLPVRARGDTVGYRVSRFVARHRVGVAATVFVVALTAAFGVTATVQARALELERDRAQREAAAAQAVSDFMVGVFETVDPMSPGRGDTVRAADLLERGARRVQDELVEEPEVQARLLRVIGLAYANLGWIDRAAPLLTRAVEIARTAEVVDSSTLVSALHRLGMLQATGTDFEAAIETFEEAVAIQERLDPAGAGHWAILTDLAYAHHGTGNGQAGREAQERAMELFNRTPYGGTEPERAALSRMMGLGGFGGDPEQEEAVFARIADVEREEAGPESARYAALLDSWARTRSRRGDYEGADTLGSRSVQIQRSIDPNSPTLSEYLLGRSELLLRLGRPQASVHAAEEALDIMVRNEGEEDRRSNYVRAALSQALSAVGRHEEAVEQQELAVRGYRQFEGDGVLVAPALWRLASHLRGAGRWDEADQRYREALTEFGARFPDDYLLTALTRADYGSLLVRAERGADAEAVLRPALDVLAARWGDTDLRADAVRVRLAEALRQQDRPQEAEALLRPVLARLEPSLGAGDSLLVEGYETLRAIEGAGTR